MSQTERPGIKIVVILSDGVRGHLNQSRGVATWIARLTGAEVLEAEVPALTGAAKARAKNAARRLPGGNRRDAREWLAMADGDAVVRRIGQWFAERNIREGTQEVLLLSAGSAAAPYNLALGYIWRCSCATIMTPSIVGTAPFDFAIVPEHDYPERRPNILVTLGSPNYVMKEDLQKEADKLLAEFPPESDVQWSVLIGGDDANYSVTPQWVKKTVGHIMSIAEQEGVDLYITTSRRTPAAAVKTLKTLAARSSSVRYLLIASEDPFNPIPSHAGLFERDIRHRGLCQHGLRDYHGRPQGRAAARGAQERAPRAAGERHSFARQRGRPASRDSLGRAQIRRGLRPFCTPRRAYRVPRLDQAPPREYRRGRNSAGGIQRSQASCSVDCRELAVINRCQKQ
jgi:hypothetical protein